MLNVYLAGEIHSNWREEIIQLCEKEKLDVKFTSPITDHEASDNCGVEILGAEEKILSLETQIFNDLILKLRPFISVIKTNSNWLAVLDCLCGFGILAEKMNYSYPTVSNSNEIKIIQGRHPVIESKLPHENPYIPNDISLVFSFIKSSGSDVSSNDTMERSFSGWSIFLS